MRALARDRARSASRRRATCRGAIARALLAKQELVDAPSVEATLARTCSGASCRCPTVPPAPTAGRRSRRRSPPCRSARTAAAGARAPTAASRRRASRARCVTSRSSRCASRASRSSRARRARARPSAAGDSIRAMLDDIAYKRGALWSWDGATVGRRARSSGCIGEPVARGRRRRVARGRRARGARRRVARICPSPLRAVDRHRARHRVRRARRRRATSSATRCRSRPTYLADQLGARDAVRQDVGRRRRLSPGAPRLPLGRRADARRSTDAESRQRARADAHLRARAPAHARGARGRARARAERSRRARRREGRSARRLPPRRLARPTRVAARGLGVPGTAAEPVPRASRGELVARVIVGEMGIGKTALVATFLAELPADARVVRDRVLARAERAAARDASRELVRDVDRRAASRLARRGATPSSAACSAPLARRPHARAASSRASPSSSPGKQRRARATRTTRSYRQRARRHAACATSSARSRCEQPLVVVIDGLQWADRASLELVQELLCSARIRCPILVAARHAPRRARRAVPRGPRARSSCTGSRAEEQIRLVEARLGVREGVAAVCARARAARRRQPVLPARDGRRAARARRARDRRARRTARHELVRHERAGDATRRCPRRSSSSSATASASCPPAEHDVVDWLAVAGGPLARDRIILALDAASPTTRPIMRLCARGLCDRKGDVVDFRHPLTRDVAYLALDAPTRARMHRRLGEHLAKTPLARGSRRAIVARHLARGEAPEPPPSSTSRPPSAARNAHQTQLALRYYQRALALLPADDPRRLDRARGARGDLPRTSAGARERARHLDALRALARESGAGALGRARAPAHRALRSRRGPPRARPPVAERAASSRASRSSPSSRSRRDAPRARSCASSATCRARSPRAIARSGRAEPARLAPRAARRGAARAGRAPPARRPRPRGGRGATSRPSPSSARSARAASEARAKNALAYAMFVLERFEDAIALALDVDPHRPRDRRPLPDRQDARATSARPTRGSATSPRGLAYLQARARGARALRRSGRARRHAALLGGDPRSRPATSTPRTRSCGDAGALVAVTGSVYDTRARAHRARARSRAPRATPRAPSLTRRGAPARRGAGRSSSYHLYATAIEAAARVDAGELHTGVLLARTALGAVEAPSGSEYGLEIRALCCEALRKGAPASARDARPPRRGARPQGRRATSATRACARSSCERPSSSASCSEAESERRLLSATTRDRRAAAGPELAATPRPRTSEPR